MTLPHEFPGPVRGASANLPLDLGKGTAPLFILRGALNVFAQEAGGRRRFLFRCESGELVCPFPDVDGRPVLGLAALGTEVIELEAAALDALPAARRQALFGRWCERLGQPQAAPASLAALAPLHQRAAQRYAGELAAATSARGAAIARAWEQGTRRYQRALGALAGLVRDAGARIAQATPEPAQPVQPRARTQAGAAAPAHTGPAGPALAALRAVAAALGATLPPSGRALRDAPLEELLAHAGMRSRAVLLRGRWWRSDNGPLLGHDADGIPCALLPSRRGYRIVRADGSQRLLDEQAAAALRPQALMPYRPLPGHALDAAALLRFGARGLAPDLCMLLLAAGAAALLGLATPLATGLLVESVIPLADLSSHWQLVGLLLAAAVGAAGFDLFKAWLLLRCETRVDLALQSALFDRLLRLPAGFFRRYTVGDLADRALAVQQIRHALSLGTFSAVLGAVFSVTSLGAMFHYSAPLALAALAPLALVLLLSAWAARRQWRHEAEQVRQRGRVEGLVLQFVSGIAKLRAAAAEPRALAAWARLYHAQAERFAGARRSAQVQELVQSCAAPLAGVALFAAMAVLLRRDPQLPAGDLLAFNAAFGQLLASVTGMTLALAGALRALPLWRRLQPLLQTEPEDAAHKRHPGQLRGAIRFSGVSFGYAAASRPVLDQVSLDIAPGQFVAIVGPSGSGKSTLLRLMMGFEQPAQGMIAFDGQPLETLDTSALRRRIGVVLQHGRIASGSLFSNIAGTARISHEQAMAVARQVGLEQDIEAMPMGLHTVLQDGGATLSGGQRQRLLLARALASEPAVLLLDEATSALDNRTQAVLMDSLERLALTRVVVAHRLSTVVKADRILVLRNGRIVQQGTYQELLGQDGLFAELAERQLL